MQETEMNQSRCEYFSFAVLFLLLNVKWFQGLTNKHVRSNSRLAVIRERDRLNIDKYDFIPCINDSVKRNGSESCISNDKYDFIFLHMTDNT